MLNLDDMIRTLESSGVHTDENVVNGILDNPKESYLRLAHIATSPEYWDNTRCNVWTPICAIHLLAKMQAYRPHLAINAAIMAYHEGAGDWFLENLPPILAYIGIGGVQTFTNFMQHVDANEYVRDVMVQVLVILSADNPGLKPDIIASIQDTVENEPDIDTRTLLINHLLDLKDPDLYEYLSDSLETGFITDDFFNKEELDAVYAGKEPVLLNSIKDPLHIFSYRDDCPYDYEGNSRTNKMTKTNENDLYNLRKNTQLSPTPLANKKIGRNDPCPCNSGKKYKKCCMSLT